MSDIIQVKKQKLKTKIINKTNLKTGVLMLEILIPFH